jgi:hypothetical protein
MNIHINTPRMWLIGQVEQWVTRCLQVITAVLSISPSLNVNPHFAAIDLHLVNFTLDGGETGHGTRQTDLFAEDYCNGINTSKNSTRTGLLCLRGGSHINHKYYYQDQEWL